MSKILKSWAIVMILSTVVMVGGCGSNNSTSDNTSGNEEPAGQSEESKSILVYSGAGLRKPIEELGQMFKEKTGILVEFSYGGSAQCVGQILTVNKGDAFLPGDVAELKPLIEKDLIDRQKPVVLHVPVLAVPQGNPAGVTCLNDLTKPGIKVVLGDQEANPIGKLSDKVLKEAGIFEQVGPNIVARAATVNEMFAYLAMKQAEASIIWEDNLVGNDKIELVKTSDFDKYIKTVPVVSLNCSENPDEATLFIDFVSSEEGIAVWEKWGFKPAPEAK